MFQRIKNSFILRVDNARQAWRAFLDGYRFGRNLAKGRSAECPLCHIAKDMISRPNDQS
jgi:hypothetical protein